MSLRKRVYEIVAEPPEGDKIGNGFSVFILTLITFNIIVGLFETIDELAANYGPFFYWFEFVSVMIFTVEYLLHFWSVTAKEKAGGAISARIKYVFSPMALIDLFAIAPFYLAAIFPGLDLRFIRVLRLLRLFRLFRSGRFADSFKTLSNVVTGKKEELIISLMVVMIMLVLSSSLMFLAEGEVKAFKYTATNQLETALTGSDEANVKTLMAANEISLGDKLAIDKASSTKWTILDMDNDTKYYILKEEDKLNVYERDTQFTSVPATMWWGIITITTIGYGDMYPMTPIGRVLGAIIGFLGICVFALPVGILGSGFVEEVEKMNKKKKADAAKAAGGKVCKHCAMPLEEA